MINNCRLCGNKTEYVFTHSVLQKYNVKYFICRNCKLLQTESPYWIDDAYNAPISIDTGTIKRNIILHKIISVIIYFIFKKDGKFIDYGGGCGVFTRLMRDVGFDFYWFDKYAENLFARGFEAVKLNKYSGATAFEVFEHFDEPLTTMEEIFSVLDNKNILFTTTLYGNHVPNPDHWWYYAFEAGQHISFYNIETLHWIAKKNNLNLWSNGRSLHCFTDKKLSQWKMRLLNKFNEFLFYYVIKMMPSRTMADHKMLINMEACNKNK